MKQPARPCDVRYLRELLARHGIHLSRRLGQHFLTDGRVPGTIVERAGITPAHGVLEIGPGAGALTRVLSKAAGRVVAVEVDKSLLPLLKETLTGLTNVTLINADILKTDLHALVREQFTYPSTRAGEGIGPYTPVICANLPYNITTPILAHLLEADLFSDITVMVQKEVAQRLCAKAGTPEYGAFTVYVGVRAACEILFDVPPHCFSPPPKVTSSVVRLTRRITPLHDPELFQRIVRAAFSQRRKTLVNALSGAFPFSKAALTDAIVSCGLSPMVRGEVLDAKDFDRLTAQLTIEVSVVPPD